MLGLGFASRSFAVMSKLLHILLYIALIATLICAGVLFFTSRAHPANQLLVVIGISLFYIIWGAVHHILEGEFDFEVLLDYLLIAGLVVVIFLLAVKY